MNDYIVFIDSGLGGASLAKDFYNKYGYNTLLVIDNENAPLGNKTKEFLLSNLIKLISKIRCEYNIKAIVLACNTLSINCFSEISKVFNLKIFKITPYLDVKEDALLLCTYATAAMVVAPENIKVLPMPKLATLIDNEYFNSSTVIDEYLQQCLSPYKNYKSIILGCTHYSIVEQNIKNIIGENVVFYDNKSSLVQDVGLILPSRNCKTSNFKVVLTKNDAKFNKIVKKYFQLD